MAAPELAAASGGRETTATRIQAPRPRYVALITGGLVVATALGAGAELVYPALFASTAPRPTLQPMVGAIASIFATNLRVLALPFVLIAARFADRRRTVLLGDLVLGAVLAGNAIRIGLALGRWQGRLLPYLPHLPLEYLATATAAAAWLDACANPERRPGEQLRVAAGYAIAAVLLLIAAACVEVLLTPRRP